MKASVNVSNTILNLLDKYAEAYKNKDLESVVKLFVPDDDMVAIGTGSDEWVKGIDELRAGFKRDMEQSDDINLKLSNITISANNQVAWLSCYMDMDAQVEGHKIIIEGRLSAVFEEIDHQWLFTHINYSLPAAEQEKGSVWPKT